jgi:hypothetical protein
MVFSFVAITVNEVSPVIAGASLEVLRLSNDGLSHNVRGCDNTHTSVYVRPQRTCDKIRLSRRILSVLSGSAVSLI